MSKTDVLPSIGIRDDGIYIDGHRMAGVTEWGISTVYSQGVTEVVLVLVTDRLTVDMTADPGCILPKACKTIQPEIRARMLAAMDNTQAAVAKLNINDGAKPCS